MAFKRLNMDRSRYLSLSLSRTCIMDFSSYSRGAQVQLSTTHESGAQKWGSVSSRVVVKSARKKVPILYTHYPVRHPSCVCAPSCIILPWEETHARSSLAPRSSSSSKMRAWTSWRKKCSRHQ
uniref:Uncharacterized protein n=1 Tax=Trichogramma kaykai TaxID=54128 RepID=A0ABD2WHL6_9HYME